MPLQQGLALHQGQRLSLKMSPRLLQSVKIMELPLTELREKINEELEKNPALEVLRDKSVVSLSEFESAGGEEKAYFETASDAGFIRTARGALESDEHQQFIEGALSRPETLQEHLLFQLRLQPVSKEVCAAGEIIIQNLSNDGFHKEDPGLLLAAADTGDVRAALELVRRLDPQGCGTADYKESLAVQARLCFGGDAQALTALFPYMDALLRGKFVQTARALEKSEDEIVELFSMLKTLTPFPGRHYAAGNGGSAARFVLPDVRVTRFEGEFKIIINNETIPVLGIAPFFAKNADVKDSAERAFIRENLVNARSFINAISRRKHTLLRVTRELVRFQRAFFEQGPRRLVPLTMRELAEKLDLHEATVSRAANGKYMETEWGVFEIKRFFSNAVRGAPEEGLRFSREGVKELMREIIRGETRSLSDAEIVSALAARGIELARRTVAKYRAQLDIGSSYAR
jgi:RNA polymerase sigma-54 factor